MRVIDYGRLTRRPIGIDARHLEYAVVDLETTGLDPAAGDRVCELAVVRMRGDGTVLAEHSTLIHPGPALADPALNGAELNGHELNGREAGGREAGGHDAGGREAGGHDAGGREAGGREAGGRDAGGREAGGRDAGGRDVGGRDAGGRDAGGREAGGREAGGREVGGHEFHAIRRADLIAAPSFADVAPGLLRLLSGAVVVGHKLAFEDSFLGAEFARLGWRARLPGLCTLTAIRSQLDLARYGLSAATEAVTGHSPTAQHTALGDARACGLLLAALLAAAPAPLHYTGPAPHAAHYLPTDLGHARPTGLDRALPTELGHARPTGHALPTDLDHALPTDPGHARPTDLGRALPTGLGRALPRDPLPAQGGGAIADRVPAAPAGPPRLPWNRHELNPERCLGRYGAEERAAALAAARWAHRLRLVARAAVALTPALVAASLPAPRVTTNLGEGFS